MRSQTPERALPNGSAACRCLWEIPTTFAQCMGSYCFNGNKQKRVLVYPVRFFLKTGTVKVQVQNAPHEPSRYWLVKSISYPFISPFLRDSDPHVHLPAANYIFRCVQVQFGWPKPALGSIRVPKPRKSSVVASVCFSLRLGVCLFYAYTINMERGTAVVSRAWFVRCCCSQINSSLQCSPSSQDRLQ